MAGSTRHGVAALSRKRPDKRWAISTSGDLSRRRVAAFQDATPSLIRGAKAKTARRGGGALSLLFIRGIDP